MPDLKPSALTLGLTLVLVSTTIAVTISARDAQTTGQRNTGLPRAGGSPSTGIVINGRELTPPQVQALVAIYRYPPPKGRFWYDSRSGLYGVDGREAAGYIQPGHNLGPLSPRASNGDTGVFINGREINQVELAFLQILFNGQVQRGRVWLDGTTWNIGAEGSVIPIANLALALQAAQRQARAGGSQWGWRDGSGAVAASDGHCTMMSVPGAPVYGTSGC